MPWEAVAVTSASSVRAARSAGTHDRLRFHPTPSPQRDRKDWSVDLEDGVVVHDAHDADLPGRVDLAVDERADRFATVADGVGDAVVGEFLGEGVEWFGAVEGAVAGVGGGDIALGAGDAGDGDGHWSSLSSAEGGRGSFGWASGAAGRAGGGVVA